MPTAADGSSSFQFPPGGIECRPGDYIIRREADGRWSVYRVEDVLLVKRLLVRSSTPASLALEEDVLDSMTPAYFREVQLLVTAFAPDFADDAAAMEVVARQTLTEGEHGMLRSAQDFPAATCRVITPH